MAATIHQNYFVSFVRIAHYPAVTIETEKNPINDQRAHKCSHSRTLVLPRRVPLSSKSLTHLRCDSSKKGTTMKEIKFMVPDVMILSHRVKTRKKLD